MEIARALHIDLTSGVVADARRPLGELAFALRSGRESEEARDPGQVLRQCGIEAEELRHHYFALLWCFERVWHGYRVISSDRLVGLGVGNEFAGMLGWPVRNWSADLPAIKQALETEVGKIHDRDSARALASLGDAVLTEEEIRSLRRKLAELRLEPVGNPAWRAR
ncbi:hypothetical protein AMK23_19595 [Streptomyces sp. CB02130]|uniref:hypothetical protein n=1 Tax=Streptomyces sp. CB02130 TaxID=1703934 RepID=UPI00093C54D0|nr:hypothetical protein [Streptomyces sp. CB02130]OKJ26216.1 hypothetical protein AMK23_19595 [Streptomyces sp. CB02130]